MEVLPLDFVVRFPDVVVEPRPWHSSIFFGLDFECPKGHRFIYKSKEIFDLVADGRDDEAQVL